MKKGDLAPARRLMAATRERAWAERSLYTDCLAVADLDLLENWCRCEPLSPDPWLLRGKARISWAWDARSSGRASEVTEEGWRLFYSRLGLARRDLEWAAERLPADPTPYICQMTVEMGGGGSTEALYDFFAEATRRHPTSYDAHSNTLYALTRQWLGSHEEMFEFARASAEKAGFDNDLAAMVAQAHGQRLVYLQFFDRDAEGMEAYLRDRNVLREVAYLFDRTFASSHYRERVDSFQAWNDFAFWFYRTEDAKRLRLCLNVIRKRYAGLFWGYYKNPAPLIAEAEAMARG